jgi:hypothetical protein
MKKTALSCQLLSTPMYLDDLVSREFVVMLISDVLMMLERFITWVNTHDGVEWVTMNEIAEDFRSRSKPPAGARMPKGF